MRTGRLAIGALLGALVVAVVGPIPTASAANYRYWQYWRVAPEATSWTFAATGPATRPAHGAVEGWRFGVSGAAGDDRPRWSASGLFEQICDGTAGPDGGKLVAVVIDFGSTADAPPGETPPQPVTGCAPLAAGQNGYDALNKVVKARITGGLVCGIAGYPARECGVLVATPAPATSSPAPSAAGRSPGSTPSVTPGTGSAAATGRPSGSADPSPAAPGSGAASGAADGSAAPSATASGPPTDGSAPAAAPQTSPVANRTAGGTAGGTLLGLLLIAALGAGAFWLRRRRA